MPTPFPEKRSLHLSARVPYIPIPCIPLPSLSTAPLLPLISPVMTRRRRRLSLARWYMTHRAPATFTCCTHLWVTLITRVLASPGVLLRVKLSETRHIGPPSPCFGPLLVRFRTSSVTAAPLLRSMLPSLTSSVPPGPPMQPIISVKSVCPPKLFTTLL